VSNTVLNGTVRSMVLFPSHNSNSRVSEISAESLTSWDLSEFAHLSGCAALGPGDLFGGVLPDSIPTL
jgi:hypothetical protein